MIPIRDLNPSRTRPVVTYALIAINAAVWLYQVFLYLGGGAAAMNAFVYQFGAVPHWLTSGEHAGSYVTPLTSMFMHGGWMHVIGNMWFLWIFGDNVEDALGKVKYVVFYVLCGLIAVVAQVIIDPDSTVPMVGASGAIAGVLGGYVLLYPRARVLTLVPIVFFITFMELPAFLFIFVWFGFQLLSGFVSLGQMSEATQGGVAFFAHVGGFLAGLALVKLMARRGRGHGPGGRKVYYRPREESRRAGEWGTDRHRPWR